MVRRSGVTIQPDGLAIPAAEEAPFGRDAERREAKRGSERRPARREAAGTRGVGASLSLLGTGLAYVWRKRRS